MKNSPYTQNFIANDELEIVELLNEISKIEENTLLDKIVTYCEKFDLDPQEIGDTLGDSEQFKLMLHTELELNHVFPMTKEPTIQIDEW